MGKTRKIKNKLLSVAVMVKDEEERIVRTLQSVIRHVCHVVILDTGSSDNTIQVIRKFCRASKIPLTLKEEPFVDFAYNRNILLKMCYGLSKYVLLLDANDEVMHPGVMMRVLREADDEDVVFGCRYILENDAGVKGNNLVFYKPKIVKNDMEDLYFEFPVHEYLTSSTTNTHISNNNLYLTDFYIYQDKLKDKSSMPRLEKDIKVLLNYQEENGECERVYEYLCQSYNLLHDYENLSHYATKLIELIESTTTDLRKKYNKNYFYGLNKKGVARAQRGDDDFFRYYLKAYEHAKLYFDNAEPLYNIAIEYNNREEYDLAYLYAKKCCDISTPPNNLELAEINFQIYETHRWKLLYHLAMRLNKQESFQLAAEHVHGRSDLVPMNFNQNSDINSIQMTDAQRKVIEELEKRKSEIKPVQKSREELEEQNKGWTMFLITVVPINLDNVGERVEDFAKYMSKYLDFHNINVRIFVVTVLNADQHLDYGLLYNLCVKTVDQMEDFVYDRAYLCIHDFYVSPTKGTNYYRPDDKTVNHIYGSTGDTDKNILDGVLAIQYQDFVDINGYPSDYLLDDFFESFEQRVVNTNLMIDKSFFYPTGDTTCFVEETKPEVVSISSSKNDIYGLSSLSRANSVDLFGCMKIGRGDGYQLLICDMDKIMDLLG